MMPSIFYKTSQSSFRNFHSNLQFSSELCLTRYYISLACHCLGWLKNIKNKIIDFRIFYSASLSLKCWYNCYINEQKIVNNHIEKQDNVNQGCEKIAHNIKSSATKPIGVRKDNILRWRNKKPWLADDVKQLAKETQKV